MRIGIYGISGSGKTYLGKMLENKLNNFKYYEGSILIDKLTDGGLSKFKNMEINKKNIIRNKLINYLYNENTKYSNIIVDGHFSFLKNGEFEIALTEYDENFYDYIFYLDLFPDFIKELHLKDLYKKREFSILEIEKWINFEKENLSSRFLNSRFVYLNSKDINKNITKIKDVIYES